MTPTDFSTPSSSGGSMLSLLRHDRQSMQEVRVHEIASPLIIEYSSDDSLDSYDTVSAQPKLIFEQELREAVDELLYSAKEQHEVQIRCLSKHGICADLGSFGIDRDQLSVDVQSAMESYGELWLVVTPAGNIDLLVEGMAPPNQSFQGSTRKWLPGWLLRLSTTACNTAATEPLPIVFREVGTESVQRGLGLQFAPCESERKEAQIASLMPEVAPQEIYCAEQAGPHCGMLRVTERLSHSLTEIMYELSLPDKLHVLEQVASKLQVCSDRGVAHMDIRTDNLVCSIAHRNLHKVKLCDWGSAILLHEFSEIRDQYLGVLASQTDSAASRLEHKLCLDEFLIRGSPILRAPELESCLNMHPRDPALAAALTKIDLTKADAWCFGLLMLYVLQPDLIYETQGRWTAKTAMEALDQIVASAPAGESQLYREMAKVAQACLHGDPGLRIHLHSAAEQLRSIHAQATTDLNQSAGVEL